MKRIGDEIIGQKYGRLTILAITGSNARWQKIVECRCDCGKQATVRLDSLQSGNTTSCGCIAHEPLRRARHGHASKLLGNSPEYRTWGEMNSRCNNPKVKAYPRYGGRGIKVCERWKLFENFLADMGPKPSPTHSLDRWPDPNGNYEPSNTRWATPVEQAWNRRTTIWIERDGIKKPLCVWADELGFDKRIIHRRYKKGWPLEKLFPPTNSQCAQPS